MNREQFDRVTHLFASITPRYTEDAWVNGIGESENPNECKMPLLDDGVWCIVIEVATGRIGAWTEGVAAKTHYKSVDENEFEALDIEGKRVAHQSGYVIPALLLGENQDSDYVKLEIDAQGIIKGFAEKWASLRPPETKYPPLFP